MKRKTKRRLRDAAILCAMVAGLVVVAAFSYQNWIQYNTSTIAQMH